MKESVIYQDIIQRGIQQGLQRGEQSIVLRHLDRRVGKIDKKTTKKIEQLSLRQLEALGEALLDFESRSDLRTWLDNADSTSAERSNN